MSRSLKKGPFVFHSLIKKVNLFNETNSFVFLKLILNIYCSIH